MNKLKFELHTHTVHSDGTFTPEELIKTAKAEGYSGVALTDHNTTSGCREAIEWGAKLGITVIPGIEWTTFYGHIVVLGGNSKVNWLDVNPDTVVECILKAREAGDIVGIAHPYRVGYPVCTGGRNCFPEEIFKYLDFYEAVSSDVDDPTNVRSISEYLKLKKQFNLTATYGRDWHGKSGNPNTKYGATYLLTEEKTLTCAQALRLIQEGKTFIGDRYTGINLLEGV